MNFRDIIHGDITFDGEDRNFITDLINSPEVQRLRFMRLLNQDALYMQELATSRRFAHSIGACYTAYEISRRSLIDSKARRTLLAAALIHDIGILPYGHLVEGELARVNPNFSHEALVRQIIHGTYHDINTYHQLLPGLSLQVNNILQRYSVDPERVLDLVIPDTPRPTPVSGQIDVDNIDNVHRMAALLGYPGAAENLRKLVSALRIDQDLRLSLDSSGIEAISVWMEYRRSIYSQFIGHPACVAYNAFLQDLVRKAIKLEIIQPESWFMYDSQFESKILQNEELKSLANQLRTGCKYRLIDYIWVELNDDIKPKSPGRLTDKLLTKLPEPPVQGAVYRLWEERNKTTRLFNMRLWDWDTGKDVAFGSPSHIILIALIDPGVVPDTRLDRFRIDRGKQSWRREVVSSLETLIPEDEMRVSYPEDQVWKGKVARDGSEQPRLF